MRIIKISFAITFIFLLMGGCSLISNNSASSSEINEFHDYLETVTKNHKERFAFNIEENIDQYQYKLSPGDVGFTIQELEKVTNYKMASKSSATKQVNSTDAIEDTEIFFRMLKYCYGPYQYFGGDLSFHNAKKDVISQIKKSDGKISTLDFQKMLINNILFINDSHFSVGGESFSDKEIYYYTEQLEFQKDNIGFFKFNNNTKLYARNVDGKDPKLYMKLSISPTGQLIYYLGETFLTKNTNSSPQVKVAYMNTDYTDIVTLEKSLPLNEPNVGYSKTAINNIPIISLRRCYDTDSKDTTCENFISDADNWKEKKVLLLDIRGNGGGEDSVILKWLANYTGKQHISPFTEGGTLITQQSKASFYLQSKSFLIQPKMTPEYFDMSNKFLDAFKNENNSWSMSKQTPRFTENKNIIFVLVDKNVASSGEAIVSQLSTLQNVVFIGTNTSGCMLSNAEILFILPNSGLVIQCGNWLNLQSSKIFNEGIGYIPDIWCGKDTLNRVINMIQYYKIGQ